MPANEMCKPIEKPKQKQKQTQNPVMITWNGIQIKQCIENNESK